MKGFLHRIATSVVQPQPSVHPFVESIYSAARQQNSGDTSGQLDTPFSDAPVERATVQSFHSEPPVEVVQQDITPQTSLGRRWMQQPAAMNERETFQSLLPQQRAEADIPAMRIESHVEAPEGDSSASLLSLQKVESRQDRRDDGSSTAMGFVPVVLDHIASANMDGVNKQLPQGLQVEISAASARTGGRRQAAQTPNLRTPPQQADEIQIHIGRIEVVAVPQAAPRPTATPARKGLSLDEYLSRRNGRVG
jgi:hypothetical protein